MREPENDAAARANTLLENLRRTPMLRGRLDERRRILRVNIETALESEDIPQRLVERIALQLVLKFQPGDLGDEAVWRALGGYLKNEITQLRERLGLTDRLIIVAVPKLSVEQIERLFEELHDVDRRYGRTLAEAALDGADPIAMGRRYGQAFKSALERLSASDPRVARMLAAAAFRTRRPLRNALAYLKRFHALVNEFKGDCTFARTVAKAAFGASDPMRAARRFIRDYRTIVAEMTSDGLEPTVARTLAGIASLGAEPRAAAHRLVENFRRVEASVKETHPTVARSVALAACRTSDPLGAASAYVANYDRIVSVIGKTEPRRAHEVAIQAFRSHEPLAWAARFRKELRAKRGKPKTQRQQ